VVTGAGVDVGRTVVTLGADDALGVASRPSSPDDAHADSVTTQALSSAATRRRSRCAHTP
ncbi:MAG: hypothetical protein QNM02_21715, partial [Acidimicrobiia bacterium]|nr:hypothetical protein [Acidimicrobiia bacterium]